MKTRTFGEVEVGPGQPPYIIAEVGSNHNGDLDLCLELIDAAADAGAHAVKFQSWDDRSLIAAEEYARNTSYSDTKRHFGSLLEMVRAYQFTEEQHRVAAERCAERGVAFCSTPFSESEVDLLVELDVPFLKVASMDVNNLRLIDYAARTGRPMVVSTGMASLAEVARAVEVVHAAGNDQLILLHCISQYPPDLDDVNLANIPMLREAFGVPVGFSDHTLGTAIPLAAIALGACVVEKHFTLDKDMEGWDHAISADVPELGALVDGSVQIARALGHSHRVVTEADLEKRRSFRRSLVVRSALPAGHRLTESDLTAKRPATGIPPEHFDTVVGRELARDVGEDEVLVWSDLR